MVSTCTTCGCQLTLAYGDWWDDSGWKGDARNGQPWHTHQPAPAEQEES